MVELDRFWTRRLRVGERGESDHLAAQLAAGEGSDRGEAFRPPYSNGPLLSIMAAMSRMVGIPIR
jgi:hypothetical protein